MGVSYHVESESVAAVDVLQNEVSGVRVRILRKGAEMISLARLHPDGTWEGFLHRDNITEPPASGWANHATVMGYYLHRLVDERSSYEGDEVRGGNHGFLRHFEFGPPTFDAAGQSLTYEVLPASIPPGAYPRPVALYLTYALQADGVRISFQFDNTDPARAAHVSFGLHPGFAVSSVASAEVILPAGSYVRHLAPGNFLNGETEVIDFAGGPMPFDKSKLEDSYLVGIDRIPNRSITLRDAGREVVFDFSEVPFMTLWSSGDDFLCIEPCWGLPDSIPQHPFQEKVGIQFIPPGGSLTAGFGISVLPAVR